MPLRPNLLTPVFIRFEYWFKANDFESRRKVAARYFSIMEECEKWDSGKTHTFCVKEDPEVCKEGIIAVTLSYFPVGSQSDEIKYCEAVTK
jgi:hypothetical protein